VYFGGYGELGSIHKENEDISLPVDGVVHLESGLEDLQGVVRRVVLRFTYKMADWLPPLSIRA